MPYHNVQLLQACEGGHDAGFVQLGFKWWSLIDCLFFRSHYYISDGDTVERKVLVRIICRKEECRTMKSKVG